MGRLTRGVMRRHNITIRPIDRKRLKEEFELFKEIYNDAWDKNWGFVPMTPHELDTLVESLGQFFDPDFAFFAEVNGVPAGFVLAIPDFNQVLQHAHAQPGTPEIFTLLKALWYWKIRPVMDWVRIPLMGVRQQFRNKGIDVALHYHVLEVCLSSPRINHCDGGWILESNKDMVGIAKKLGSEIYKTHRFYELKL